MSDDSRYAVWEMMKEAGGVAHLLNAPGESLHVVHRLGVAQLDRSLVELSCTAPARGHALPVIVHHPELADGVGIILSRGFLVPCPCQLVVHVDTEALVVHAAELMLARSMTRLGTDLVRRHRPRVVDRHAFSGETDIGDGLSCFGVALW